MNDVDPHDETVGASASIEAASSSSITATETALDEQLLAAIVAGRGSPQQLATATGLSFAELASWFATPANTRVLEHLAALADLHVQMLVAQHRVRAALRLLDIVQLENKDQFELIRKACVDLLRISLPLPDALRSSNNDEDGLAVSEAKILQALESIGKEGEEQIDKSTNQQVDTIEQHDDSGCHGQAPKDSACYGTRSTDN